MKLGKLGCIVQARMTSSRLPGKVLKTLDYTTGKSILEQVIERLKLVEEIDEIIIATTINADDEPIVAHAEKAGVGSFRGSEHDVLERYYKAAEHYDLDTVIRITSDCPFIDPEVIADLIETYKAGDYDYVSNGQNRTFPHGLDCEIFSFDALKTAYDVSEDKFYREHVTTYIYNHRDQFKIGSLELKGEDFSGMRITVDTESDYVVACLISDSLGSKGTYSFRDIVKLYEEKPFLSLINKDIVQKKKYDTLDEELKAAAGILRLQELNNAVAVLERELEK